MNKKILVIASDADNMFRSIQRLKRKDHEVKLTYTPEGVKAYYENDIYDHLNYFDLIFLNPFMPSGMLSTEEDDPTHIGWLLYERFLRNLKTTKIVILAWKVSDYQYPTNEHSDRKWGDNMVAIIQKDPTYEDSLLDLVEKYCK